MESEAIGVKKGKRKIYGREYAAALCGISPRHAARLFGPSYSSAEIYRYLYSKIVKGLESDEDERTVIDLREEVETLASDGTRWRYRIQVIDGNRCLYDLKRKVVCTAIDYRLG